MNGNNKEIKQNKRVAIQGTLGAFHEIAARAYFSDEDVEVIPLETFREMVDSVSEKVADYGIMAIENSVAGSILPNYALITEANKRIVGEIYLRIKQNFLVPKGKKIEDIKEVYSHPMAILQCQNFFRQYKHIKLIDGGDTATCARKIADGTYKNAGAIASKYAAERYGLAILSEGIETNKMNYTRFLILKDKTDYTQNDIDVNKASLHFVLVHEVGSLAKVLSIFMFHYINISKIQSMPIVGKDWEYQFYVDVEFEDYNRYNQTLEAIQPFLNEINILGEYQKGTTVYQ